MRAPIPPCFVILTSEIVQRNFLSKLHERSRAALQSINQYKWMASAQCCSHARDHQGDFAKLIAEAKRPKATLSFAFERHITDVGILLFGGSIFSSGCDCYRVSDPKTTWLTTSRLRPQRYSEVLEAEIPFLQNDELFYGNQDTCSNLTTTPWPSDPFWQNHQAVVIPRPGNMPSSTPVVPTARTVPSSTRTKTCSTSLAQQACRTPWRKGKDAEQGAEHHAHPRR